MKKWERMAGEVRLVSYLAGDEKWRGVLVTPPEVWREDSVWVSLEDIPRVIRALQEFQREAKGE
jgi:hypothetical protein